MIKHYPFGQLGKANHGWLKANHHFSFAHYYNPRRMDFGTLRVINDDWVAPGQGFAPHSHQNMEIITFVRTGEIAHQDNQGNKGITPAGEVQVMSAGSGITHSEYNLSKDPLTLYQIWIEPNKHNVKPRWDSKAFPQQQNTDHLPLLVSGFSEDKDQALFIHQQARIFGGKLKNGATITHKITDQAYVLASQGTIELIDNQQRIVLEQGDGAEVTAQQQLGIIALTDSQVLIIDVPK